VYSEEEVQSPWDSIASAVARSGLYFVGRLRKSGIWQSVFFGPASRNEELNEAARKLVGATLVDGAPWMMYLWVR